MNLAGICHSLVCLMILVGGMFSIVSAETIRIQPSADTTLVETVPDNNVGGTPFVNAGTSGIGTKNRGLYRFDLDPIPSGSKIKSASFFVEVTREPNGGVVASLFSLRRLFKSWGEGDKDSSL